MQVFFLEFYSYTDDWICLHERFIHASTDFERRFEMLQKYLY